MNGKPLVWDFTCVHRLAPSYLSNAINEGPVVANSAELIKARKYIELELSHFVQPIAAETLGGLGSSSLDFLKDLGKRIYRSTGQKRSAEFLRQRLGIAVQIGNASSVLETFGRRNDPLDIDFAR